LLILYENVEIFLVLLTIGFDLIVESFEGLRVTTIAVDFL
jgi:hypothetical protein